MKFRVGDRVHWWTDKRDTGTVIETASSIGECYSVHWDDGLITIHEVKYLHHDYGWNDFIERIKDRMS